MALAAAPELASPVLDLAKAIQLSVAPVFLLTAISGLLGQAPDEMGFSVLNPDYEGIQRVARPAFAAGTVALSKARNVSRVRPD